MSTWKSIEHKFTSKLYNLVTACCSSHFLGTHVARSCVELYTPSMSYRSNDMCVGECIYTGSNL